MRMHFFEISRSLFGLLQYVICFWVAIHDHLFLLSFFTTVWIGQRSRCEKLKLYGPHKLQAGGNYCRYKILRLRFSRIFERHHMFLARSSSSILNNEVFQAKKLSRPWSELFACKSSMFFLTNLHLRSATWWASKWRTHFELCKLVHWQSLPKEIHMQLSNICKIVLSKELFTLH